MAASEAKPNGGARTGSSSSDERADPAEALTAAVASAEAAFRVHRDGDRLVMVAFGLGWQMAEVYRPDRRRGSTPVAEDDLPGISRLSTAEIQEMGLFQIQAGIAKLQDSIRDAGLDVPDAQRFGEAVRGLSSEERDTAIRDFHVRLLSVLTAADFRLGKAYGLGRALADTTRQPPDWRRELSSYRVSVLADWIRDLTSAFPPHAAHPVAQSLEAWSRWAPTARGDGVDTVRKFSAQGRLWRSLLSGEKQAVSVLETSDFLRAGEGMLSRNGRLAVQFLRHYWWLVVLIVFLMAAGVWLIVGPGSGIASGLGVASIFTSLGLSWKGIGTSLGAVGARIEEPIWQTQLDQAIYERTTPDEIVQSQRNRKPGPDDPALVADQHQWLTDQTSAASATGPAPSSRDTRGDNP